MKDFFGFSHGKVKTAPMDMLITVGVGDATVTRNGKVVWKKCCNMAYEDIWTVQDAENAALQAPGDDWKITLYAPLHGQVYKRQGKGKWVLISENNGFEKVGETEDD